MNLTTFVRAALAAAALIATAVPGLAMDAMVTKAGDLEISSGYSRATLPNAPVGAGFLTILNTGSTADRLVAATSPVTDQVQLHEMAMEGGVMKMRQLKDGIPIPAGATVKLDPSNLHLMFMHLNQPLREGTTIEVTLSFEKAGKVTVPLTVGGIAAKAMPGMSMGDGLSPDVLAITKLLKATFETPAAPLSLDPIVVSGEFAIAGWSQDGKGGRALLRKTGSGWALHLCSGDALKSADNLVQIGLPESDAKTLSARLAAAESKIDPKVLGLYSGFAGTMMVDASLIKPKA